MAARIAVLAAAAAGAALTVWASSGRRLASGPASASGVHDRRPRVTSAGLGRAVPVAAHMAPACSVSEAVDAKATFPQLGWQPYGAGREVLEVASGDGALATLPAASTYRRKSGEGADAYVAYTLARRDAGRSQAVLRWVRLEDGLPVAALERAQDLDAGWSHCTLAANPEGVAVAVLRGGIDVRRRESRETYGIAPLAGGRWTWATPAMLDHELPSGLVFFDLEIGNGRLFQVGKGGVWSLEDPSRNVWEPLEVPSSSEYGSGEGDLALWTDYPGAGRERIRGWAPDGLGVRTIVTEPPQRTCHVVATPTSIVGSVKEGSVDCEAASPLRLWRAPRVYRATGAAPGVSPRLGGVRLVTTGLRAWGDWAAVHVRDTRGNGVGSAHLLVVRLSSWQTWRIAARAETDEIQSDAWTLTDEYLYYAEIARDDDPQALRRMVRIRLRNIERVAESVR